MCSSRVVVGTGSSSVSRKVLGVLGLVFCLLLTSSPMFAQGTFGRILGTVTDQSGGTVAGATVTVLDTERGTPKVLTTNESGEYNAPTLVPSTYKVRAESKGFKVTERAGILVEVGKEIRIDLVLQTGAQEQTVVITESAPLVETTNAVLGGTINNADINDMPLNGRNYQNLLSLRPGVVLQPGGGPWTQSTNGIRPDETVWMLEGIVNANMYDSRPIANMPSPFSDGATILPVDAIQEFNTEISPKAEYGWKPGAVVNVGVKSGTNEIHGSAYGFYRTAAWDARNLFNPDVQANAPHACDAAPAGNPALCAKLPTQLKQFGGVVGGPIKKDKLFYFAGYEGLRSLIGNAIVTGGTPETGVSNGDFKHNMVDAIMTLQTAGVAISPVAMAIACPNLSGKTVVATDSCTPASWSFPNNPTGSTNFTAIFPNTNVSDNGVAKIDYHVNDKNSINGMVFIGNYTGDGMDHPFLNQIFRDTNLDRTYTVGGDWVYAASSRMVNDFRIGYNKVGFVFLTDDGTRLSDGSGLTGGAGFPVNTGVTQFPGLPNINISGFEKLGSWHNRPQNWDNHFTDLQDSVSYLMGKHTLKFGGEVALVDIHNAIPDTGRGLIAFKGKKTAAVANLKCKDSSGNPKSCALQDFFAGFPSGGNLLSGSANREETWNSFAFFAQDDWRVGQKLTVNLGLRYGYNMAIKEVNGLWGNFDPAKGLVQQAKGGSLFPSDPKDFSPRIGVAWDVTGKGTTVVRAGFSINYSLITAVTFLNQNGFTAPGSTSVALPAVPTAAIIETNGLGLAGNTTTPGGTINLQSASLFSNQLCFDPATCAPAIKTANGGKVFPSAVAQCGDGNGLDVGPCNIMAVDPKFTTPYLTNWNFGIQHSFGENLSLEVNYVGNHGSRLTGFRDINQTDATGARPYDGHSGSLGNFPYLKWIYQISNDGRSNFNSLQTSLTKRTSHGLSFIAGYSYSHGLDTASLNRTAYLPQNSQNVAGEYASGDFDIRHRFTFTTTYLVPGIHGYAQMLEGWKLNAIVSAQTGQPWLIYDSNNDFLGGDNVDRWNINGPASAFTSGPNGIPYCSSGGHNGCGITSGINGVTTFFTDAQSANMWSKCTGVPGVDMGNLTGNGCYVSGNSVITPPANGTYGNIGRNIFRDSGFKNVDFSVFKMFTFKERYSAQLRLEVFNIFNHPLSANPYGSANGYGVGNDPSVGSNGGGIFGCGCATPDIAGGSPQVGSGGPRGMQVGLKLAF